MENTIHVLDDQLIIFSYGPKGGSLNKNKIEEFLGHIKYCSVLVIVNLINNLSTVTIFMGTPQCAFLILKRDKDVDHIVYLISECFAYKQRIKY